MGDSELDAIRAQRMAQMQSQFVSISIEFFFLLLFRSQQPTGQIMCGVQLYLCDIHMLGKSNWKARGVKNFFYFIWTK